MRGAAEGDYTSPASGEQAGHPGESIAQDRASASQTGGSFLYCFSILLAKNSEKMGQLDYASERSHV
jgi:hypothetical protein